MEDELITSAPNVVRSVACILFGMRSVSAKINLQIGDFGNNACFLGMLFELWLCITNIAMSSNSFALVPHVRGKRSAV